MGPPGGPLNRAFIVLIRIYKELVNPGVKPAIVSTVYVKALENRDNIRDSFHVPSVFVSSEKALPCEFIRIPMLINRLTVGINSLNGIPFFARAGSTPYIIMTTKTIFNINPPDTICIMLFGQATGRTLITFIFFDDINPVKTYVQRVKRNNKLG